MSDTVTISKATTYFSNGKVAKFPKPDAKTLVEMENRRACVRVAERMIAVEFPWLKNNS